MKKQTKISLSVLTLLGLILVVYLAIQNWGFFVYNYNVTVSEEIASYRDTVVDLSKTDPAQAFVAFKKILEEDSLSYNNCHGIAHEMGHEVYEHFGFEKAMEVQNTLCGGGYIHGVIEGRFGVMQEKDILEELPKLCADGSLTCYHGIGHGLMITTDLDIPTSLAYCDRLPGKVSARNCYDGVWMHIFDLEESGVREIVDLSTALTPETIATSVGLCAGTGVTYKSSCYFYLPRIFAHHAELPFQRYVDTCSKVEKDFRVACAAGSGHSIMKYHINDPNTSMNSCEGYGTAELVRGCKEGGSLYYLYNTETSSDEPVDLREVCEGFVTEANKEICLNVVKYRGVL